MKILVFTPFSEIWPHVFPEALVCEALQQNGHEIFYITCGGALNSLCVVQQSKNLKLHSITNEIRRKLCRACSQNKKLILNEFKFNGFDLSTYLTEQDKNSASEIVEEIKQEKILEFKYDSINLGQISLYTSLLQFKKNNLKFTHEEWNQCKESVKNSILVVKSAKKIITQLAPDMLITYNNLYDVNAAFSAVARQYGMQVYSIHAQGNLAHKNGLFFTNESNFGFGRYILKFWPRVRDLPCPPEYLSKVTDHFLEATKGLSVFAYSAPKNHLEQVDIRKIFKINATAKILCATMSSYDERFAGEITENVPKLKDVLFTTSVDWISALIDHVKTRPDLFLIVRVHPREFPNKREGEKSSHAEQLQNTFQNLPENIAINWPDQKISLYDLADQVDVFLNAWSSAGKEMAMLGLPVVLYSRTILFYPYDLHEWGETRETYFEAIEKSLHEGWNFERIRKVYRWQAIELNRSAISIEESAPVFKYKLKHPLFVRAWRKLIRTTRIGYYEKQAMQARNKNPKFYQDIQKIIMNKLPNSIDIHDFSVPKDYNLSTETVYLKKEIQRIINALYPNNYMVRKGSLHEKLLKAVE